MIKRLAAGALGIFLVVASPLPALAFFDTQGHWAGNTIKHLTARTIVHGKSAEIFAPDLPVTRAEFATLLTNGLDLEAETRSLQKGSSSFSDISTGFWAKGSLELCYELQIMVPDSWGRCYPNRSITRAETAVMVAQALGLPEAEGVTFNDEDMIPAWAAKATKAVSHSGIMKGFPDGTFRPQSNLTRAQAAVIVEKILEYRGEKYQGTGQLQSLDLIARNAKLSIDGKTHSFSLADNFVIEPLSKTGYLNLPFPCCFDLNREGQLAYCLELAASPARQELFTTRKAPVSPDAERSPSFLEFGENLYPDAPEAIVPWAAKTGGRRLDPRMSSSLNSSEIKALELKELANVDGSGIKIAVIDTGIDPGHLDLRQTADGRVKVTDWVDLTDQGKVELTPAAIEGGRVVLPDDDTVSLGGYYSRSGQACYGFLDLARLPVKLPTGKQKILVIALDTTHAGIYDTILIDLNGNGRVDDEKPFTVYGNSKKYLSFMTLEEKPFNFVVSKISPAGDYVKLGFDAVGHGTKVAGVAAGNGLLQGIAPGAQLVAIKVFDGFTGTDISRLKEAIKMAGNMGVQVVNLSMGYSNLSENERWELEAAINDVTVSQGVTFCISAGNLGPGLESISTPAGSQKGISVGGYLSPAMWALNYGWQVSQATLWYFSSVGPYAGGVAPLVVAPASAVTSDVGWRGEYTLEEGTSIAAPYVAGGVALLIQAAHQEGIRVSPEILRLALARGAEPLSGHSLLETGYGVLNLAESWKALQEGVLLPFAYQQGAGGRGLYARSYLPGQSYLEMNNPSGINEYLELSSTSPWIKVSQSRIQVPTRGQRSISLEYENPEDPGLYSGLVVGNDPISKETRLEALQTVIVPYKLLPGSAISVSDELGAGMYQRYFVKVPEGNGQMNLKVTIPKDRSGKYQGRVRMYLVDPSGNLIHSSGYAGSGYPTTSGYEYLDYTRANPAPGVWEIVVYSSISLAQYDLTTSKFTLGANLVDWVKSEPQAPQDKYLITTVNNIKAGVPSRITLHFWDKVSKLPARGRVLINNLIYDLKNGKVHLAITPQDWFPCLEIAW